MTGEGTPGKEKVEMTNNMILEAQIVGQKKWASFLGEALFFLLFKLYNKLNKSNRLILGT